MAITVKDGGGANQSIEVPNANGQATMANSAPVVIASNQSTIVTGGTVAHDAADSGNPHKIGAIATASLSGGTNVAAADRTDAKAALDGALLVRNVCLEDIISATPVVITDGSSTSVIAAQGAGIRMYVTDIEISNSSATNVTVDIRDGVAGSVLWTLSVPATGGNNRNFTTPLRGSANTAICADPSAAASSITVSINGFKSKV